MKEKKSILDRLGVKKEKSEEEKALDREMEKAWRLYGNEVDAFLDNAKLDQEFEKLEKSKFVSRPKVEINVSNSPNTETKPAPLPDYIKKLVENGGIQGSKAHRFARDAKLRKMLESQIARKDQSPQPPQAAQPTELPDYIKKLVENGVIQGSKAHRFVYDAKLRKMLESQ